MSRERDDIKDSVMDAFNVASKKDYPQQAIFFLNAFWEEHSREAEKVWDYLQGFIVLDKKKDEGCELDEFYSHKFLENYGETMTALELRNAMRLIDINHDNQMSLLEYLLFRFDEKVEVLISRPQENGADEGRMSPALLKAWKALQAVRTEIRKIESKKAELQEKAALGGVKGNTAKQELFALLNNDPTELNAAMLTAEAAVRKAGGADLAMIAPGLMWYMERELEEAKKYQPKGGIKKGDKFKNL